MSLLRTTSPLLRVYKHSSFVLIKNNYSSNVKHYDIIIAGGGLVGTTLACTLGRNEKLANKKILLLEGGKPFTWKPEETYSNRVVAINPNTYNLFNRIDVWKHIVKTRIGLVHKLQVWDSVSDSMITFNNDLFAEPVAYIVENNLILSSVYTELTNIKNVTIVNEAKIKDCELYDVEKNVSTVVMADGNNYTCDLLLGCDGANSKVRKALDVQYLSWDYNQMGIVATLQLTEVPDNCVAWQRFLPTGPIAFLPLKENLSSLVWSTTIEEAKKLLALSEEQFTDAVNEAIWKVYKKETIVTEATKLFDGFLRSLNLPSNAVRQLPPSVKSIVKNSRAAFPLGFGHSTSYVSKGVALVGDAAHRVHPMAGQGVNLGFGDVACLDRVLGDAIYAGSKLGELNDLKEYETERQRHNVPTMLAIDGLHRLYNNDFTPLVLIRSLGLQCTNAFDGLKKVIMVQGST